MATDYGSMCRPSLGTDCRFCPYPITNETTEYYYCKLSESCCINRCCTKNDVVGLPLPTILLVIIFACLLAWILHVCCCKGKGTKHGLPVDWNGAHEKKQQNVKVKERNTEEIVELSMPLTSVKVQEPEVQASPTNHV